MPQWSEWSACTKNRTRTDLSCIASDSSDAFASTSSCPTEVETEECSSSGKLLGLDLEWSVVTEAPKHLNTGHCAYFY